MSVLKASSLPSPFSWRGRPGHTAIEPTLLRISRGVTFRRFRSAQQALGAQVFVNIRPVDSVATGNFPVLALSGRGVQQTRIHTRGTLITRPSRRNTLNASALNATSRTRSSAPIAEPIPPPRPSRARAPAPHHPIAQPSQSLPATPHTAPPPDGTRPLFPRDPAAPVSAWSRHRMCRSCAG